MLLQPASLHGSLLRCVGSHVTLPKSQNNLELVARLPVTNQTLILIFLTFIFSMAAGIHPIMIRISFILSSLKAWKLDGLCNLSESNLL